MMRLAAHHDQGADDRDDAAAPGECPFLPMVGQYCDDELEPSVRRQFKLHLEHCPACTEQVGQVQGLSELFGSARTLQPRADVLERLHDRISADGDFAGRRRISDALPMARMLLALAASVLIVAGAWMLDGRGAPTVSSPVPIAQRLAEAPAWERTALTLEVDPPNIPAGLQPDQQRVVNWMVASLDKPEHP